MSYKEIKLDIDQNIKNITFIAGKLIEKVFPDEPEQMIENFNYQFTTRIDYHQSEDLTDY